MKGLVAVPLIWVAIFVIWFFTTARPATGQEVLPQSSPFLTACTFAQQLGQIEQVSVSNCRKVAEVVEGNTALVTVKVKVAGQGWFIVSTALQRSEWSHSAFSVQPVG